MTFDWKLLAPHRPLEPGAPQYIARPDSGGDAIAAWVRAGGMTVLVGGPTGVGKSTELARAAAALQNAFVACLVPLDRLENIRRLTPDRMRLRMAGRLVYVASEHLHLPVSAELTAALARAGALPGAQASGPSFQADAATLLADAIAEVCRLARQHALAFLLDGLEKVPEGPDALELFDALAALPADVALVTAVPWHAAFGPQAEQVVRAGERFEAIRPLVVEGPGGPVGWQFLETILRHRLGLADAEPVWDAALVRQAAQRSGGLPRTFLQLVADAGTYARMRDKEWPDLTDFEDAVADQRESFRRLLLPGDRQAMTPVDGTDDGPEMDLHRKIRLLSHGVLLERRLAGRTVLVSHPLIRKAAPVA